MHMSLRGLSIGLATIMALITVPPTVAAAPPSPEPPVSSARHSSCELTSTMKIAVDGVAGARYLDQATGRTSSEPLSTELDCTTRPDALGDELAASADYGSVTLTQRAPSARRSDGNGWWDVQASMTTAGLPSSWTYQVKASPYTTAWSGTKASVTTRTDGRRICHYNKVGESPLYLQHGSCSGHSKGRTYTTNGTTTWRFIVPGGQGTATLTWTARYKLA